MRSLLFIALFSSACTVGSIEPTGSQGTSVDAAVGGGGGGGGGGSGSGSGGGSGSGAARTLSVTFTSSPNAGPYAPNNVVAVWIEGNAGAFVKTIGRWSAVRTGSLVAWNGKSGGDADAVSGATRLNHTAPLTVTWNLKDKLGAAVADGTYTIRMEMADSNATTAGQNKQGTFTFVNGTAPQKQTALTNGGFSNVTVDFTP
jgi:hypothetical protein